MRFLRKAKRPVKFTFTISINEIMVEGSNRWQPRKLSVKLRRKKRNYAIEPKAWEPTLRNPYRGIAFWSQAAKMQFVVTLFKNSVDAFEEKQWKLTILDHGQNGRIRKIASKLIDLSLHTTSPVPIDRLPLKTLEPALNSTVSFSISAEPMNKVTDTQTISNEAASPQIILQQHQPNSNDGQNIHSEDATKASLKDNHSCLLESTFSREIKSENNTSDGLNLIIEDLRLESQKVASKSYNKSDDPPIILEANYESGGAKEKLDAQPAITPERDDSTQRAIHSQSHSSSQLPFTESKEKDSSENLSHDKTQNKDRPPIDVTIIDWSSNNKEYYKEETPEETRARALREKARKLIADVRRGELPIPSRGSVSAHSTPKKSFILNNVRSNGFASISSFETAPQNSIEIYDYGSSIDDDDDTEDRLNAFRRNSVSTRSARMRRFRFYQFKRIHDDQATENLSQSPGACQLDSTTSNEFIATLTNNNNNERDSRVQQMVNQFNHEVSNNYGSTNRSTSTIDRFESCDPNQSMLIPREDVIQGKIPIGLKDPSYVGDELKSLEEEQRKIEEKIALIKSRFMELTQKNGSLKIVEQNTGGSLLAHFSLSNKLSETIGINFDNNSSDETNSNPVNSGMEDKQKEILEQICELVNKKNDVIRRQMQLNLLQKEKVLERTFEQIDKELRSIMLIEEPKKTESQKQREKYLLNERVALVEKRNELVHDLDAQEKAIEEDINLRENLRHVKLGDVTGDQNCCIQ